jgi:hypothetical protein
LVTMGTRPTKLPSTARSLVLTGHYLPGLLYGLGSKVQCCTQHGPPSAPAYMSGSRHRPRPLHLHPAGHRRAPAATGTAVWHRLWDNGMGFTGTSAIPTQLTRPDKQRTTKAPETVYRNGTMC